MRAGGNSSVNLVTVLLTIFASSLSTNMYNRRFVFNIKLLFEFLWFLCKAKNCLMVR